MQSIKSLLLFRALCSAPKIQSFSGRGLGVAPLTPFIENGDVNYSVFEDIINYFQKTHIECIFVNGTLGEGMNLQINERKLCAEKWIAAAKGRIEKVIVHVGAGNLRDSQELARHAEESGASAIGAISPTFYKPGGVEMMVEYMSHVAKAAPSTPFYYYDYDTQTGIKIDVIKFLKLASEKIPNFRGVKYTSVDLPNWQRATELEDGKYDILTGCVDIYLPCLSVGVRNPITLPFFGEFFHSMRTSYDAGDMVNARVTQSKLLDLLKLLSKYGLETGTFKAAFAAFSGVDMGPVRLPLRNKTVQEKEGLLQDLKTNSFL